MTKRTSIEIQEIKEMLGLNETQPPEEGRVESSRRGDDATERYCLHLIDELASTLNFLKQGILYRNKRVYNKLKALSLKTKRSASNYSNSSHFNNSASAFGGQKSSVGAPQTKNGSKDAGSNQDKNSAKLTPPSGNHNKTSGKGTQKPLGGKQVNMSKSVGFSPIVSVKSYRYEDIEQIYNQIVDQEDLRRLKHQKLMAKKRQLKKKKMLS